MGLIRRGASCKCLWMKSPFRYFRTSPEIIRLAVVMQVRFPLSLRNVEDLLRERGIEVSHETIRFWWNGFGPIFAAEFRKKRTGRMRALANAITCDVPWTRKARCWRPLSRRREIARPP